MLKLQEYLQTNSLESLKDNFAISYNRHSKYPNLVLLKYNQIDSDFSLQIVQESRGIILDENDNWNVVNLTYFKFFNCGENLATQINWNNIRVLEKVDGSLMQLFNYNDEWLVASSGSCDASGTVDIHNFTFNDLFGKVWNELKYKLPFFSYCKSNSVPIDSMDLCFAFELCTNYNKIVVQHPKNRLVLHGIRNKKTLEEYSTDSEMVTFLQRILNWEIIKSFPLNSLSDIENATKNMKGFEQEGFVIVDGNFNRLKIKSPDYVSLHHLKSSFSKDKLLDLVKKNEDEWLIYFPEYKEFYTEMSKKYYILINDLEQHWNTIKEITDRKEFAMNAKNCKCSDCMFKLKDKRYENVKNYLTFCRNEYILDMLEKIDIKD